MVAAKDLAEAHALTPGLWVPANVRFLRLRLLPLTTAMGSGAAAKGGTDPVLAT